MSLLVTSLGALSKHCLISLQCCISAWYDHSHTSKQLSQGMSHQKGLVSKPGPGSRACILKGSRKLATQKVSQPSCLSCRSWGKTRQAFWLAGYCVKLSATFLDCLTHCDTLWHTVTSQVPTLTLQRHTLTLQLRLPALLALILRRGGKRTGPNLGSNCSPVLKAPLMLQ